MKYVPLAGFRVIKFRFILQNGYLILKFVSFKEYAALINVIVYSVLTSIFLVNKEIKKIKPFRYLLNPEPDISIMPGSTTCCIIN